MCMRLALVRIRSTSLICSLGEPFFCVFVGMVDTLTKESATSKSVYFAHCTSEMIFITHLLAKEPEKLAGPLLADTYVTLLKGRNAWYGQKLAKGELNLGMGDSIKGKGMIQVIIHICINQCLRLGNDERLVLMYRGFLR